ncbi:hypothetical protein UU5_19211 [Rhodanobacter sp. 115]|nr:hypothetical protein UU5_19211 [Rhodanobacter sp. 115]
MHFQAIGVRHDVAVAGRGQLETGAVVGADLQMQGQAFGIGRALADCLGGLVGDGDFRRGAVGLGHAEQLVQFAAAVHLADDVGAADQLTLHVQLRNGRPAAEFLDAFADFRIVQHVDGVVIRQQLVERVGRGGRETAHRLLAVALHEQHHAVVLEQGFDTFAGRSVEGHGKASGKQAKREWYP